MSSINRTRTVFIREDSAATKPVPESALDGRESPLHRPFFGQYAPARRGPARQANRHHQHQLCLSHLPVAPCGRPPDGLPANSEVVADRCDKLAARNLNSGFDSRRQVTVGSRNPFLKYRGDPLFDVLECRIPATRFCQNNR